jgi:hypothetical protein
MDKEQFPIRPNNHILETKSSNFFKNCLPQEWSVNKFENDYGQDLYIEISEEFKMKGLGLIIQLKASQTSDIEKDYVTISLSTSTYNYLRNKLDVVMLVKYIEDTNQAYWLLLKKVVPPADTQQESFTIRVPRENNLQKINWDDIVDYVRQVAAKKLNAWNG